MVAPRRWHSSASADIPAPAMPMKWRGRESFGSISGMRSFHCGLRMRIPEKREDVRRNFARGIRLCTGERAIVQRREPCAVLEQRPHERVKTLEGEIALSQVNRGARLLERERV